MVMALAAGLNADAASVRGMTAEEILGRMAAVYASCKSYRDTGVVKTVYISKRSHATEKPFSTAFVRPDRFRFEYRERRKGQREDRYIIWSRGGKVRRWWDVTPEAEEPESLSAALAAAAGVSSGASRTIPALLLSSVKGRRLTDLAEARRIADAKLDEADCFRVEGRDNRALATVWIDQKTFLVKRIDTQVKFADFRTEETTTYDSAVDEPIADKTLEFDPPERR